MAIDWGDAPAWVAIAVGLGALGVAVWAAVEARKARKAGEDSAKEAKRSADAGEISAQAAVRSAEAAEKAHQLAEQQYQDSLPLPVAWEIQQVGKSKFQLINVGTATATGVTIDQNAAPIGRQLPTNETVRGDGGYVEFMMFGSMQARIPNKIEVTCNEAPTPVVVPVQKF